MTEEFVVKQDGDQTPLIKLKNAGKAGFWIWIYAEDTMVGAELDPDEINDLIFWLQSQIQNNHKVEKTT